jgi:small basic protein (TIGR04137 family)
LAEIRHQSRAKRHFPENFFFRIATGGKSPQSPRPRESLTFKSNASVGGKRSVLKRFERVKLLKERGEWKSGRSPLGLPKTKHEG